MTLIIWIYYKTIITYGKIKLFFMRGRINALHEENEKFKNALGKHDFPTSTISTKHHDSE